MGQLTVYEHIKSRRGRLAQAYIVSSPSEETRQKAAEALAGAMVCSAGDGARPCGLCRDCLKAARGIHPDIAIITRQTDEKGAQKREISIGQIRDMIADAYVVPNDADTKAYILLDGDWIGPAAQNAMLKVLEEPPAQAGFILCAESPEGLLDTIRSRCIQLDLGGEEDLADPAAAQAAERYLTLVQADDRAGVAALCWELSELDNARARAFLDQVRRLAADRLCRTDGDRERLSALIRLMDRAEDCLRVNVGIRHVFGLISAKTFYRSEEST